MVNNFCVLLVTGGNLPIFKKGNLLKLAMHNETVEYLLFHN